MAAPFSNASVLETAASGSEALLAAVRKSLETELHRPISNLTIREAARRRYSRTWQIQIDERRFLLKWLPHRAARELELTLATRKLFLGERFFQVPAFACAPTPDTFLVEWVPGEPLNACCTCPPLGPFGGWLKRQTSVLKNVGIWLNRFHASTRRIEMSSLEGFLRYISNREKVFSSLDAGIVKDLMRAVESHTAKSTVRVHGDFSPHNVLVDEDVVGVIDFAGINEFDRGSSWFDISAMYLGLEEYWQKRARNYLRFTKAPLQQLQEAFLDGCGVSSTEDPVFGLARAIRHFSKLYSLHQRQGPGGKAWNRQLQHLRRALSTI